MNNQTKQSDDDELSQAESLMLTTSLLALACSVLTTVSGF